jgi:hypothetical protein
MNIAKITVDKGAALREIGKILNQRKFLLLQKQARKDLRNMAVFPKKISGNRDYWRQATLDFKFFLKVIIDFFGPLQFISNPL